MLHMPDYRCYCGDVQNQTISEIQLSVEESTHLVAANRARVGQPVVAFNGNGLEWNCTLAVADKKRAILEVDSIKPPQTTEYRISLGQCIPKGKLIESIIRKATEIGAYSIHPITSERSEFRLKKGREGTKETKWTASAIEGAKQSGNPNLPIIEPPTNIADFIANSSGNFDLKLIACLRENSDSLKNILAKQTSKPRSAIILVGPEGDLAADEIDAAIDAGFIPITLGPYVLRCETAAISCLSILRHELS